MPSKKVLALMAGITIFGWFEEVSELHPKPHVHQEEQIVLQMPESYPVHASGLNIENINGWQYRPTGYR